MTRVEIRCDLRWPKTAMLGVEQRLVEFCHPGSELMGRKTRSIDPQEEPKVGRVSEQRPSCGRGAGAPRLSAHACLDRDRDSLTLVPSPSHGRRSECFVDALTIEPTPSNFGASAMSTSVGTSGPTTAAPRPSTLTSSSTPQPPPLPSWTQPVLDIVAARKDTKRGRRRRGSDQPRDIRHQVGKKVYLLTESETALVQEAYERQCAEWRRATEALRASSRAHPSGDLRQPDFNDPASAVPSKKRGQKDPISRDGPSTKRARKSAKGSALSQRIDPQSTTASNASFQDVKGLEEYRLNDMPHAEVYYVPTFVSTELAEEWYQNLQKLDTCEPLLCGERRRQLISTA